jgi:hypothetical protein
MHLNIDSRSNVMVCGYDILRILAKNRVTMKYRWTRQALAETLRRCRILIGADAAASAPRLRVPACLSGGWQREGSWNFANPEVLHLLRVTDTAIGRPERRDFQGERNVYLTFEDQRRGG